MIRSFTPDELLCETADVALYRAHTESGRAVLMKVLKEARCTWSKFASLLREAEVAKMAGAEVAAKPEGVMAVYGRPTLVLHDDGGVPLARLLGSPLPLGRFFPLALELVSAVEKVHARHLVHGELHPFDILVLGGTNAGVRVELIGFGRSRDIVVSVAPAKRSAATRPYFSPEQTGRLRDAVDERSDLYSVGILLFQMLAGTRPFEATDLVGWIQAHCAIAAPPLSSVIPAVPPALSHIVSRLLAKRPEARYQTAAGLRADLERAFESWKATGNVQPFSLGRWDPLPRLRLSGQLYGRHDEVRRLRAALMSKGRLHRAAFVFVCGSAGVGKTALVEDAFQTLAVSSEPRLVATGRCHRSTRYVPGAPVFEALGGILRAALESSNESPGALGEALEAALGANLPLLATLLPGFSRVVPTATLPVHTPFRETKERLLLALDQFVTVFSTNERPIVLSIDDLHWADEVTLEVLTHWAVDERSPPMRVVGTYRTEEVNADQRLRMAIDRMRDAHGATEIALEPLSAETVTVWLADAVRVPLEEVGPLGAPIWKKTRGNPLFVVRFMDALSQRGVIRWHAPTCQWRCSIEDLQLESYADNVTELIAEEIAELSPTAREALGFLAGYGARADPAIVGAILECSEEEAITRLDDAFRARLVERVEGEIRFLHHQIQRVAYERLGDEREQVHLRIGRALLPRSMPDDACSAIFDISRQFELAGAALVDPHERVRVADLELEAGKRAHAAALFATAVRSLTRGIELLCDRAWESHRELSFGLHLALARSRLASGELGDARALGATLLNHVRTCREVAEVRKLLAAIDLVQGAFHEAVTEYLQGLHALGIDIPAHPDRMMAERAMRAAMDRLFSGALDSVEASPHEPTAAAACDLLASLVTPSAVIDPNLLRVVASLGAERALEAGNPSGAALAYSAFAAQLCGEGCYDDAERLALHACELVNRETDAAHRSWARIVYAAFLSYLSRPVPECLALLHRERDTASAIGDLDFASYAAIHATYFAFVGGENLKDVADAGETATAMASRANSSIVLGNVECMLQLVECLRVPANAAEFVRAPATEVAAATLDVLTHFNALYCEVVAAFLFGRHERASRACALAIEVSDFVTGFLDVPDLHFFGALAAARAPAKGHVAASSQRSTVDERHAILRALATKSPKNFGARDALVAAELARLRGDVLGAERGYERAVHLARGAGQIHVEAIASECAATFHRDRGMQTAADAYLVQAHACYEAWGATSKATILAQSHPCLSDRPTSSADLASIVEIQRALSGAFRLPELHARLIDLVLEHASAKRGCILNVDHEQRLVVVAQSAPDGAPFGAVDGPADPLRVPFSMCNAAIRRQKAVFVADRIVDHRWMFDPHFAFSAVRSALCLPIVREDRVTALVYVEGDAEPGSFGPSALSALEAIGAQAAVALENARMYSCLEQENAVRRAAEAKLAQSQRLFIATLDASPLVVFMKDLEGRYLFINRRFEEIFLVGSQIIGKTDYDIFPRESADFFRNTDFRALAEDRAVEIDEIVAHGDGFHFYRTLKFSLRDESDKPWAICGIATDVTSRKRADEELRRSLSLLEATLDATHDAIIVFDLAGKVVRYNRRFVTMWQLPEEDFRGYHERELRSLVVDQLVDPASFGAISERGLPLDGETDRAETIAFKDGRVYEVVARPQRLGGKVVGRVVSIRDVSERMRAAEVRSQLLAEEKRARTDLEEAVRARDNFLSVASHELRTPLASVSLAVETLEASLSEPIDIARVRRSAAIAKRQVQRIVSLVDMLLDVSRLRSGKLVLSPAPVDLRTVIGEVSALLASELARSGSELVVNAPEPVVGNWDALRIEQVLTNLLTNAIKFGRGAPIVIELSRQGNQARLSVTDKGIGIPSDPRGRIFEAYTRLVSTRQFGGLGLGLHITKTIVEAHGGTLSVESQEGVGSTFTVTLPLDTPLTP